MNKKFVPYHIASAMKELGYSVSAPIFQEAFDWFEDEHSIYIERNVYTNVNEIFDITYYLKSWKFPPVEIKFEDPYECFDRYKARVACLEKMIEITKTSQE